MTTATCMCGAKIWLHDRDPLVGGGQQWLHTDTQSELCYPYADDDSRECVAEPESGDGSPARAFFDATREAMERVAVELAAPSPIFGEPGSVVSYVEQMRQAGYSVTVVDPKADVAGLVLPPAPTRPRVVTANAAAAWAGFVVGVIVGFRCARGRV